MFAWFAIITRNVFNKKTYAKNNNIPEVLCTVASLLITTKKKTATTVYITQQRASALLLWPETYLCRFFFVHFSTTKSKPNCCGKVSSRITRKQRENSLLAAVKISLFDTKNVREREKKTTEFWVIFFLCVSLTLSFWGWSSYEGKVRCTGI